MEEKQNPVKKPSFLKSLQYSGNLQRIIVYSASGIPAAVLVIFGILALIGIFDPIHLGDIVIGTWYDFIIIAAIIFSGVFGFYEFYRLRIIRKIDQRFPDFVRDLAESRRAGMTFTKAIMHASKGNYGVLTPEIQKIARQISWGSSVEDALASFAKRVNTKLIKRTISLIIEASRSGGHVADVLDAASKDAREIKLIESERKASLMSYVAIVYVGMFVFLLIVVIICVTLLPNIVGTPTTGSGNASLGSASTTVKEVALTFFTAALFQSAFMGIVAGVFEEGEVVAGVKHSFVMLIITWLVFKLIALGV